MHLSEKPVDQGVNYSYNDTYSTTLDVASFRFPVQKIRSDVFLATPRGIGGTTASMSRDHPRFAGRVLHICIPIRNPSWIASIAFRGETQSPI
jgi:hypothetical protein